MNEEQKYRWTESRKFGKRKLTNLSETSENQSIIH